MMFASVQDLPDKPIRWLLVWPPASARCATISIIIVVVVKESGERRAAGGRFPAGGASSAAPCRDRQSSNGRIWPKCEREPERDRCAALEIGAECDHSTLAAIMFRTSASLSPACAARLVKVRQLARCVA